MTGDDPTLPLRLLVETAWRARRRLALLGAALLGLAITLAALLPPSFRSHSTIVYLLGPEYTVRATPGLGTVSNTALDPDHILGAEDAILASDDLHRQVIAEIGLARLYPRLLRKPGLRARLIAGASRLIGGTAPVRRGDRMDMAAAIFADHLSTRPARLACVITLAFSHRDPALAQATLATLERLYLERRRALYASARSDALAGDVARARAALDASDAAIAAFRTRNAIADYPTELAIALRARGDADADADAAARDAAAASARNSAFVRDLAQLPSEVGGGGDTEAATEIAPVREAAESLRTREADMIGRYRPDGRFARAAASMRRAREADLARARAAPKLQSRRTVRNPAYDAAATGALEEGVQRAGAEARRAADAAESARLAARIAGLVGHAHALDLLLAEHDARLDTYRRLSADLAAEQSLERIEDTALPSARIAASPDLPARPTERRALVLIAGAALAAALPAAAALGMHATRRTIMLAAELEALGLTALADIPLNDRLAAMGPIVPLYPYRG